MIELFNDVMRSFAIIVDAFFSKFAFIDGLSVGWVLLAISVVGLTISFLYGRMR